jgi:signal recognition particle GTPase
MAIKAIINSTGKNRVSIDTQKRVEVKTALVPAVNKLTQLIDVDASDSDNNETLVYDADSGKYVIKVLPIINGGTF